ncbi:thiamine phosphate synthase [Polaromonas sp.]|uniref:thiamine phosphate synthase n=1 Tax=Polaromonas sp. TaxID=1869339 RepID=UPI0017AC35AB|nr:thiamine phosphate synthase [Polaromonas sp.]NMM04822.1 thiamine phosphate synthase [Polaromonas sp.]
MTRLNPDALRLYLVTDQSLVRGRPLADVVAAAVQGGVSCVQLREKNLGTRDFLAQALMLKKLLAPHRVPLVINDRIDIALACGAEGVHLGQSDLPVTEARRLLPPEVFIGWSVESMDEVLQSVALPLDSLDYLGVSPIFATPTKTDIGNAWGLGGLARVRAATRLPLVAIGGIHAGNARQVLQAGADGLAVVSALCAADDPQAAAAGIRAMCDQELTARRTAND